MGVGSKGAFRQILGYFAKHHVTVAYTSGGIDCYSLIIEEALLTHSKYAILAEIEEELKPDRIAVSGPLAVLAVVGRKMVLRAGSSGKILSTLGNANINIRMISQGPEELNVIVGVDEKDFNDAVRVLYETMIRQ